MPPVDVMVLAPPSDAFAVFDRQGSGCLSWGVERNGARYFVKSATTPTAVRSLRRAIRFHRAVTHPAIVSPLGAVTDGSGAVIAYPWHDGEVLNAATASGSDRQALDRFLAGALPDRICSIDTILAAHRAVTAAGFVAVDLYDGCMLWDSATTSMRLIDLDEYRPGPFVTTVDRLPGSLRYQAPEEFARGNTIDERTTDFTLGRVLTHLLGTAATPHDASVIARATASDPADRYPTVSVLIDAWRTNGTLRPD